MKDPQELLTEVEAERLGTNLALLFQSLVNAGLSRREALELVTALVTRQPAKD